MSDEKKTPPVTDLDTKNDDDSTELVERLSQVIDRISSNSAMSNNFETLLYKVDKIEEAQGIVIGRVEKFNQTLYHPVEGVFAKFHDVNSQRTKDKVELETRIKDIEHWQKVDDDRRPEQEQTVKKTVEDLAITKQQVEDLGTWQKSVSAASKWIIVTVGSALVGLLFKLLYDFITNHIVIT